MQVIRLTSVLALALAMHATCPLALGDEEKLSEQDKAAKAACTTIGADVTSPPSLPADYPVRSQGDFNACQSYTATLMADSWLIKNKKVAASYRTSPVASYFRFLKGKGATLDSERLGDAFGGTPSSSLDVAIRPPGKACSNEALKDIDPEKFFDYSEQLRKCQVRYKALLADASKNNKTVDDNARAALLNEAQCVIANELKVKGLAYDSLQLAKLLESKHYGDILYDIIDKACAKPGMEVATDGMPALTEVSLYEQKKDATGKFSYKLLPENFSKIKKSVVDALSAGNPAAMAYCSKYLKTTDPEDLEMIYPPERPNAFATYATTSKFDVPKLTEKCGPHVSPVTRREWHNGACMYLVHNSWGMDCKVYDASRKKNCDKGKLWVRENELFENIISVSTF
ncbi:MAG: hypothetical protein HY075_01500 [Deltaproteobacteria bacterium]|nr:hypothetical protein [Deltaproteobacteria bacterium]